MGQPIIKLNDGQRDWYLVWSTIVDAPITYGGTVDDLREYIQAEHGAQGLRELEARLARVEAKGTSAHLDESAEVTIRCNRAGSGETELTREQIIEKYCHNRPKPWGMLKDESTTILELERASKVMHDRADQCRKMAHTYDASFFHGEALVQRSRAEAYEAAAITLTEMAEGRA